MGDLSQEIRQQGLGRAGWGDIYSFDTPKTDKALENLYLEQRTRKAAQQKATKELDDGFNKNIAAIRDIDVPEYVQKYQDWKTAAKALIKNKNLKPQEFAQLQMDANRKLADLHTLGNGSKSAREDEHKLLNGINTHPDTYDDNAGTILATRLKTPYGQLGNFNTKDATGKDVTIDLTDPNTYTYKGTNTNFQAIDKAAQGQIKDVSTKYEPYGKGGLQSKKINFQYGNTPADYKDSYLGALATQKGGRDAAAMWDQLNPATISEIDKKYNAITPDTWEQMTGKPIPQNIEPSNPDNKSEQFATHMAKLYALNTLAKRNESIISNRNEIMDKGLANQKTMEGIRQANRKQLLGLREAAKKSGADAEGLWAGSYIKKIKQEAKGDYEYKKADGTITKERQSNLDPVIAKALSRNINGKFYEPDVLRITPEGNFRPIFFKRDDDGKTILANGNYAVDINLSQPITDDQVKLALISKVVGAKQRDDEMLNNTEDAVFPVQSTGGWKTRAKK